MAFPPKPKSLSPIATKLSRSRDALICNQAICLGLPPPRSYKNLISALQDLSPEPRPTPHITDVHTLSLTISPWPTTHYPLPTTHPKQSCPELLERLSNDQRANFLRVWDLPPPHLRDTTFDIHGSGWSPSEITALGNVLCDFPDVFSTSKTVFGSSSFIPFKISMPADSAPV